MKLQHVGLVYRSEERAERFLGGVLGLRKSEPKLLPAELCRALFDCDRELRAIKYTGAGLCFEALIDAAHTGQDRPLAHVLLEVADLPAFLERCHRAQAAIRTFQRGDAVLVFVSDEDGNLFEIKRE